MADENEKWEMPKPIFRSSTGSLPKTLQRTISGYNMPRVNMNAPEEDDDILSVLEPPKNTQTEPPEISEVKPPATIESRPVETAAPPQSAAAPADQSAIPNPVKVKAAEVMPKRSGFSSFVVIILLIAMLAAAIIVGLIYFLPRFLQPGSTTF